MNAPCRSSFRIPGVRRCRGRALRGVTDAASGERGVAVAVTFDAVVGVRDDARASCVVRATSIRKHGKTSARSSVQLQNFEVVSSVQPIQMFRVLASSQNANRRQLFDGEKRKCPTVERITKRCTRVSKNRKRAFFPYALQRDEKKKTVASLCAQQKKTPEEKFRSTPSARGGYARPPRLAAARRPGRAPRRAPRGTRRPRVRP